MENRFGLIEDKSVRPCHSTENEIHLASMAQAKDRSGWVIVAAFALISDIEIAVGAEVQIVKPLKRPLLPRSRIRVRPPVCGSKARIPFRWSATKMRPSL